MTSTLVLRGCALLLCLCLPLSSVDAQGKLCTIDPIGPSLFTTDLILSEELHCPCPGTPQLVINHDRSYEAALIWEGPSAAGVNVGALAEPFETPGGEPGSVCFMIVRLYGTTSDSTLVDLIVWDDDNGRPGAIQGVIPGFKFGVVPPWPSGLQRSVDFDIESSIVPVEGKFWAGLRATPGSDSCAVLLGADVNGGRGGAMVYVPPGADAPEGWQTVESVYGQDLSLAVSILVGSCVNPTLEASWGQIKELYRRLPDPGLVTRDRRSAIEVR